MQARVSLCIPTVFSILILWLPGGSRAQLGSVLTKLRELADVQEKLGQQRAAAAAASARLEGNAAAAKRFAELSRRVELKRHEAVSN